MFSGHPESTEHRRDIKRHRFSKYSSVRHRNDKARASRVRIYPSAAQNGGMQCLSDQMITKVKIKSRRGNRDPAQRYKTDDLC